jgi:transcriptional regulator with XRE-family HTH domain
MRTTIARAHDRGPVTPLEHARRVAGLSLTELASLSGVSRMTIHKLEHVGQSPTLDTAQRLAVALKSSVDVLFPIEGREP